MLGKVFQRFVEKSPATVRVAGILERVLNPELLDELFDHTAKQQYTRELVFSTVFDLMSQVVYGMQPSIHAAYQASIEEISVSITSVYNKLNGLEPQIPAALVRHTAHELAPVIEEMDGAREPLVAGYQSKIVDGNCIEATEHRLKELRQPYHCTRSAASVASLTAQVLSSNHSMGSTPSGGLSSTTCTAHTVSLGNFWAVRWRGGHKLSAQKRRLKVAVRAI
jgi:hypothetical protein